MKLRVLYFILVWFIVYFKLNTYSLCFSIFFFFPTSCLSAWLLGCLTTSSVGFVKSYTRGGKQPGERREPSLTMINSTLLLQGGRVVSAGCFNPCCLFHSPCTARIPHALCCCCCCCCSQLYFHVFVYFIPYCCSFFLVYQVYICTSDGEALYTIV